MFAKVHSVVKGAHEKWAFVFYPGGDCFFHGHPLPYLLDGCRPDFSLWKREEPNSAILGLGGNCH